MDERAEVTTLQEHDRRSDERAHFLANKIDKLKEATTMSEPTHIKNIFEPNPNAGNDQWFAKRCYNK